MSLVCWSGGCDSTLALLDLSRESSEAHPVKALSVSHPQVIGDEEHRKARQAILEWARNKGHHIVHQELHLRVHGSDGKITGAGGKEGWFNADQNGGLIQPIMWMPLAATYLDVREDLYMGYVREDDIWHYEGNFTRMFGDLQFLMNKKGSIKYPLKGESKVDVIRRLKELGVLDLCWYCEDPKKGKPCDDCPSCRRHLTGLWQLDRFKPVEDEKDVEKEDDVKAEVRKAETPGSPEGSS